MNPRYPRLFLGLALALAALQVSAAPLRVLFFTKSSGWVHDVINQNNERPSYAEAVLTKLGAKNDIEFTFS